MASSYHTVSTPAVLDISLMIAAEDDPKQRAFLIVLNSINLALEANTVTVKDISFKLETHLLAYNQSTKNSEEIINKGKGAWKVIAWVIGIAQVGCLAAWIQLRTDLTELTTNSRNTQIADVKVNARLDALEGNKTKAAESIVSTPSTTHIIRTK
jgi:hypothetical protein